jgi:hypothetical protein
VREERPLRWCKLRSDCAPAPASASALALAPPPSGFRLRRLFAGASFLVKSESVTFFVNQLLTLWRPCNTAKTLRF